MMKSVWSRRVLTATALSILISLAILIQSSSAAEISQTDFYKNAAFEYSNKGMSSPPFKYYDINGIPYVNRYGKLLIHPVLLEQRMLEYHGTGFGAHDMGNRALFKRVMNNIINSKLFNSPSGKIEYGFDFRAGRYGYLFKKGWASAMAQGQMLSLLARAYLDYPDMRAKIRKYADNVMRPLEVPVKDNGLMFHVHIDNQTYQFYSEYPAKTHAPLTLNGFMFTLIGLREYAYVTGSETATRLWNQGVDTLESILPFYDTRPLSTYDLSYITFPKVLANYSVGYHKIHIAQLGYMYKATGQPLFACIRDSMEKNLNDALKTHGGKLDNFEFRTHYEVPVWESVCKAYFKQPVEVYKNHDFSVN